ncbi:putative dehydrogenase [Paenarthrobacter nicotinovorans]|nr:putative dehydrogenase [Paenarthrobacter nicotinovorans]
MASRSEDRARSFAAQNGLARGYGSYTEFLKDPDIDVVYVAAPNAYHAELALLAIEAGKNVLVEKPFATSATEGRSIARAAKSAGVFAMEAMWTRYLPQSYILRQLLDSHAVGDISMVQADFGFSASPTLHARLFDARESGGALLDAGVYPLSFAMSVLGPPLTINAVGQVAESGVETEATLVMDHGSSRSVVMTSINAHLPVRASIMGSDGHIEILPPFIGASGIRIVRNGRAPWTFDTEEWADPARQEFYGGLHYQADALARFVAEGRYESPLHSLEETILTLEAIDVAKAQMGTFVPN